jgi:hypothetical protein
MPRHLCNAVLTCQELLPGFVPGFVGVALI